MNAARYHILLTLAEGPLHGAEIRRRAESQSDGGVTLYPATLYGTLDDLESNGWIEEVDGPEASPDRTRWRFYELTVEGRAALRAETARLAAVLRVARATLREAPGA